MADNLLENKIKISETCHSDLHNLMSLWNNGQVMAFVGFPEGLGITEDKLENWLNWAISKPGRCHYCIYHTDLGFCGETFYNVLEKHDVAALDIKLLPISQGKGIAEYSLRFAINQAFRIGKAKKVYVDPHPENKKAWKLYKKLGFINKPRPVFLQEWDTYLELAEADWNKFSRLESKN